MRINNYNYGDDNYNNNGYPINLNIESDIMIKHELLNHQESSIYNTKCMRLKHVLTKRVLCLHYKHTLIDLNELKLYFIQYTTQNIFVSMR